VAVTTVYSVPDDGRKGRPKHVELLTPNKEHKKFASRWHFNIKDTKEQTNKHTSRVAHTPPQFKRSKTPVFTTMTASPIGYTLRTRW